MQGKFQPLHALCFPLSRYHALGRGTGSAERRISDVHNAAQPRKVLPEFAVAQAQNAPSLAAAERHVARIEAGRVPRPRKVLQEFAVAQAQSARSLAAAERHVARIEVARQLAQ